jgi:hypothetical protein
VRSLALPYSSPQRGVVRNESAKPFGCAGSATAGSAHQWGFAIYGASHDY